jgi:hypothetical protein
VIRNWKAGGTPPAEAFAFKAAADVKKVTTKDLSNFDEVPAGTMAGEKQ